MSAEPRAIVNSFADKLPLGPSTSNTRTELVPSIIASRPFTLIALVITGKPFSPPLSTAVRSYSHRRARLIVPPPAEFAVLIAATRAPWPAQGTLIEDEADAEVTNRSATSSTLDVATTRKNTLLILPPYFE
jgi:hypothetical protein